MPEQENDGLVPPLKVLRRRLNGVYRADGFSGPTRRYVLIVALLVGLASLPTLAAITAGTDELDGGTTGAMDVPFLPPPSAGQVVPVRPAPSVSPSQSPPFREPDSPKGYAGEQQTAPSAPAKGSHASKPSNSNGPRGSASNDSNGPNGPNGANGSVDAQESNESNGSGDSNGPNGSSGSDGVPAWSGNIPGVPARPSNTPARPGDIPARPGDSTPPNKPVEPARPTEPAPGDRPPSPGHPLCHERGKCGSRESRHHRPDWFRHRHCEESTHRAHWSHHRDGSTRSVVVHIVPTGRHGHRVTVRENSDERHASMERPDSAERHVIRWQKPRHTSDERRTAKHRSHNRISDEHNAGTRHDASDERDARTKHDTDAGAEQDTEHEASTGRQRGAGTEHQHDSHVQHRSADRSQDSQRSTMTERPHNIRPARTADRTHNSRRMSESRWDEPQMSSRSYHGSHREQGAHHTDDAQSAAHDRSSRVGRHHAGHHEERSNRR